jgi:stage V sporulation protein SpoVS
MQHKRHSPLITKGNEERAEVQAICAAVHTQAVKDAYAAHINAEASANT